MSTFPLTHESYIGARARSDATRPGMVQEIFPPAYWPGDDVFDHLVFALKYDDFNLDVLGQCLVSLGPDHVRQYVESQPNSKYARQLGYLYEMLAGHELPLAVMIGGAYVDLLDPDKYMVAVVPARSTRWHVNDNLLGSMRFCPVIRKTAALRALLTVDVSSQLRTFQARIDPVLFQRAVDYLYFKETRSSFNIERETPTPDREQRFVRALHDAGSTSVAEALSEAQLTALQHVIVEPRYAQEGFRTWQNYVGESMPGRTPRVHYVCPPGDMVKELMSGLLDCASKTQGLHPVVRAALISFGFVFVHPFEDGNGRIHRYLIHDFLARDGVVPQGMVLPVSAYMLHHSQEYERVLEAYSKPLRSVVSISMHDDESLTINNPSEVAGAYRYPDLTWQAHYLLQAVEQTVNTELVSEILFIRGYDQAKSAIREIVDMPDKRLDLLIKLMHQNKGKLARGKRKVFDELSDEEMAHMEQAFMDAFAERDLDARAETDE